MAGRLCAFNPFTSRKSRNFGKGSKIFSQNWTFRAQLSTGIKFYSLPPRYRGTGTGGRKFGDRGRVPSPALKWFFGFILLIFNNHSKGSKLLPSPPPPTSSAHARTMTMPLLIVRPVGCQPRGESQINRKKKFCSPLLTPRHFPWKKHWNFTEHGKCLLRHNQVEISPVSHPPTHQSIIGVCYVRPPDIGRSGVDRGERKNIFDTPKKNNECTESFPWANITPGRVNNEKVGGNSTFL